MHSGMRADIEREIKIKMDENLEKQADGIELISVLMKRIRLPLGLSNSIEQRLQAEQDAMRMEFVIQQAKLEAERKIIDAEGERDAQIILATGLTPDIIKIKSIDAFNKLSISPNSKIIITDGKTPMLINANE
jgi:regulator of protease activity HflC (stomatin/prohibitin superfamily)